jgi:hypothetical protein
MSFGIRINYFAMLLALVIPSSFITAGAYANNATSNLDMISTDKDLYLVGETVEITINAQVGAGSSYILEIKSSSKSFTYRGEYNQVMFFYPLEEDTYTAALVDFSTRAIIFDKSFPVKAKLTGFEPESSERQNAMKLSGQARQYSGFSIEKNDYTQGEIVRFTYSGIDSSNLLGLELYYQFGNTLKKYAADIRSVQFTPEGVGSQSLVIKGAKGQEVGYYPFIVHPTGKKLAKVLASKGIQSSAEAIIIDESGLEVSDMVAGENYTATIMLERNIKNITFKKLSGRQSIDLRYEDLSTSILKLEDMVTVKSYAIDPTNLDFEEAVVTAVAVGRELWKCADWIYNSQACTGKWVKVLDIVPGEVYEFTINATDPGFSETNPTTGTPDAGNVVNVANVNYINGNFNDTSTDNNVFWAAGVDNPGGVSNSPVGFLNVTYNITQINLSSPSQIFNMSINISYCQSSDIAPPTTCAALQSGVTWNPSNVEIYNYSSGTYVSLGAIPLRSGTEGVNIYNVTASFTNYVRNNLINIRLWLNFTITTSNRDATLAIDYAALTIRHDRIFPSINYSAPTPASGTLRLFNYTTINVTANDTNLRNISIFLYDSTGSLVRNQSVNTATTPANLSVNFTNLEDGLYYFNASAFDFVGNANYTITRNITLDSTPPNITFISPTDPSGTTVARNYTFMNITAFDGNLRNITVFLYNSTGSLISSNTSNATSSTQSFFQNFTQLSAGLYYFNATATDVANRTNFTATRNITIDLNPPSVQFTSQTETSDSLIGRSYIRINSTASGTAYQNLSTSLYNSTSGLVINASTTQNNLTLNITGLTDGLYYFNSTACNNEGRCNFTETRNITTDTASPAVQYNPPTEAPGSSLDRNYLRVNTSASDPAFQNLSTRLYNSTLGIAFNATTIQTNLTLNITGLPDGLYYFNSTACDAVGNCNTTDTRNTTIDLNYPTVYFAEPTDNSSASLDRPYIHVNSTAIDANLKNITIYIYNSTGSLKLSQSSPASPFFWNATGLTQGVYYFNSTACDTSGKCNYTETRNLTMEDVDTPEIGFAPPTEEHLASLDRAYIQVNVSANDSGLKNITIYLYNSSGLLSILVGNSSPLFWNATMLYNGQYWFNATACDTSGKCNSTETRSLTVTDSTIPAVYFTSPTDASGSFVKRQYIITNTSAIDSNLKNITVRVYNITGSQVAVANATNPVIYKEFFLFTDGLFYYNATACDLANNCNATETRNITLDTTGPDIVLDRPRHFENITDASLAVVNATVNDLGVGNISNTIFEYRRPAISWSQICDLEGIQPYNCTWDVSGLEDAPDYEVRVSANDSLGNDASFDTHANITIDNYGPNITVYSPENNTIIGSDQTVIQFIANDLGSGIVNCSLYWQGTLNQTNSSILENQTTFFALQNLENGFYSWSINCTDTFNHQTTAGSFNLTVSLSYFLKAAVTSDKSTYQNGTLRSEPINILANTTGLFNNSIAQANITTDLIRVFNTTENVATWWNTSWRMRKPIFLTSNSTQNRTNIQVSVNITGLSGNITNCNNEIRVADLYGQLTSVGIISGDNSNYCYIAFLANVTANTTNENNYFAYYNNSASASPGPTLTPNFATTVFLEDFESGTWETIAGEDPSTGCSSGSGAFSNCSDLGDYEFARTSGPFPISGTYTLVVEDWDTWSSTAGIWHVINAFTACAGDSCQSLQVSGYVASASLDSGSEFCRVWARNSSASTSVNLFDCTGPDPACEFGDGNNDMPTQASHYEFFSINLSNQETLGLTSLMSVHIGGQVPAHDDQCFFDDILITGFRQQAPNVTNSRVGSVQIWIERQTNSTNIFGFAGFTFNPSNLSYSNYSAASLATKQDYNKAYNYTFFQFVRDFTGPEALLNDPLDDEVISAFNLSFAYTLNATVTDLSNLTVYFDYRINSTQPWQTICNTSNSTAYPYYYCTWDLQNLTTRSTYQVRVYAQDILGFNSSQDVHVNITIDASLPVAINSVAVDDDILVPANEIDLTAGSFKQVICNVSASDQDTYENILSVNATFYAYTTQYNASDDPRLHYTNNTCNRTYAFEKDAHYACTFQVAYYALNGTWTCRAEARSNLTTVEGFDTVSVNQLFAVNISQELIDYDQLASGEISADRIVNITNLGNIPINISVYGFGGDNATTGANLSMTCHVNNISITRQRYALTSVPFASKTQLSSNPQSLGFTILPKQNISDIQYNTTYWQLQAPTTEFAIGQCNGSLVFSANSAG